DRHGHHRICRRIPVRGKFVDDSIKLVRQAAEIIIHGMATVGTPWSEQGMSKEFGQKFPGSMDKLYQVLGGDGGGEDGAKPVVEGLMSLQKDFLQMAENIDVTEEHNQR